MVNFFHKIFSVISIKFWLQFTLLLSIIFSCYSAGLFLANLVDIYYLKDVVTFKKNDSLLASRADKEISIQTFSDLILNNMFNTTPPPNNILQDETTKSNLDQVVLIGTLVWTDKALAITSLEGAIDVVLKGNKLPYSDIKLAEVERDRILVKSGISNRWITLINNKSSAGDSNSRQTLSINKQENRTPNSNTVSKGGIVLEAAQTNKQSVFITRERANFEIANFKQLINKARVFPAFDDAGATKGVIFDYIEPGSVFEQIGLKEGDIIERVNGQTIDSPERAFDLYRALRNENNIQVTISRNSKNFVLDYHVN